MCTDPALLCALIDEFVHDRDYVPSAAKRIEAAHELPLAFRAHTIATSGRTQWRAWSCGSRLWFVVGEIVPVHEAACDAIMLGLEFYNNDGVIIASAVWQRRGPRKWVLRRIIDLGSAQLQRENSLDASTMQHGESW